MNFLLLKIIFSSPKNKSSDVNKTYIDISNGQKFKLKYLPILKWLFIILPPHSKDPCGTSGQSKQPQLFYGAFGIGQSSLRFSFQISLGTGTRCLRSLVTHAEKGCEGMGQYLGMRRSLWPLH